MKLPHPPSRILRSKSSSAWKHLNLDHKWRRSAAIQPRFQGIPVACGVKVAPTYCHVSPTTLYRVTTAMLLFVYKSAWEKRRNSCRYGGPTLPKLNVFIVTRPFSFVSNVVKLIEKHHGSAPSEFRTLTRFIYVSGQGQGAAGGLRGKLTSLVAFCEASLC